MQESDSQSSGRDVLIEGSAQGVIITGNQNRVTVHTADQPITPKTAAAKPNPYHGLAAFSEVDANQFFGREEQIEQLLQKFSSLLTTSTNAEAPTRLIAVLGPSGSGKSSLVRAGLIPQLANHPFPARSDPLVASLTPGSHPVEALAYAMVRALTKDAAPAQKGREFTEELRLANSHGQYDGLRRIADSAANASSSPLILFVDQFEEVYTQCECKTRRSIFVENLLSAASDRGGRVAIIICLRSDFLGRTHEHPVLNSTIARQHFIVPVMTEDQLRRAIAEPAGDAGRPLDEATVQLLVAETIGREGALPMLQFALTKLWDGLTAGVAATETLKRIGGVGGALAGEAQQIFDGLDRAGRDTARRVFLSLVQLGEGTRDTRRRVAIDDLLSHHDNPADVRATINRFAAPDTRLLTLSSDSQDAEIVEMTHEALLEHWHLFGEWIDASREDIRFQRRFDDAARHWDSQGRPDGPLWRPPDLDLLADYHGRLADHLTPRQLAFFEASRNLEKRRKRRRHQAVSAIAFITVLAIIGAIVSLIFAIEATIARSDLQNEIIVRKGAEEDALAEAHRATASEAEAERQSYFANVRATQALLHLGEVEQANRHLDAAPRELRDWEWFHLKARCDPSLLTLIGHESRSEGPMAFSPDGERLAVASLDSLSSAVRLWETSSGHEIATLEEDQGVIVAMAFSPDGSRLATAAKSATGGPVRLWDAVTAKERPRTLLRLCMPVSVLLCVVALGLMAMTSPQDTPHPRDLIDRVVTEDMLEVQELAHEWSTYRHIGSAGAMAAPSSAC